MTAAKRTKKKVSDKKTSDAGGLGIIFGRMDEIWPDTGENESLAIVPDQQLLHIPSKGLILDRLLGGPTLPAIGKPVCPGYPRGRITMISGEHSTGKTTLALSACAETCARGGIAVYVDWEHEVSEVYAHKLGCPTDPNRFRVWQPPTLEKGIAGILLCADAGVDLIVIDSIGAAVPGKLYEQSVEETGDEIRMGLLAATWSKYLPKIKAIIKQTNTAIIAISQLRATMSTMGRGPSSKPQGGKAWSYYMAVHLHLRLKQKEKGKIFNPLTRKWEDGIIGVNVIGELKKCKISIEAYRSMEFYIRHGEGIDNVYSIIDIGINWGFIKRSGAWHSIELPNGETLKVSGKENFRAELLKQPQSVLDQLVDKCRQCLNGELDMGVVELDYSDAPEDEKSTPDLLEGLVPEEDEDQDE